MLKNVAVLIPCYNESITIEKVILDWIRELPEATIYVYDNNSTDNSVEIVNSLLNKGNIVLRHEGQQGKGNVVRRMFREIDADCYIMIDGDDTYPAEYGRQMAEEVLLNGVDMVIGDRLSATYFSENKRRFHNFGNRFVKWSINKLFKTDINDIMTGFRAFSYNFVKTFPVLSKGFEIETEMTIHAIDKNFSIKNICVEYRDRPEGSESKLNTISDGLKVIYTILKLYKDYKPFCFFGVISLLVAFVSLVFFLPVFIEYLHTGTVEKIPTLIVCGFCVMASLISFFSGLILQTIIRMDKRRFEYSLQQTDSKRRNQNGNV